MPLDKDIEILSHLSTAGAPKLTLDEINAVKLGNEALKRELYHRSCYPNQSPNLLPGETKD